MQDPFGQPRSSVMASMSVVTVTARADTSSKHTLRSRLGVV